MSELLIIQLPPIADLRPNGAKTRKWTDDELESYISSLPEVESIEKYAAGIDVEFRLQVINSRHVRALILRWQLDRRIVE